MSNSFYVQLSPYLLLEYIYNDSTYVSSQVKLARIKNQYRNGEIQFLNTYPAVGVTQNVLDYSAANLGGYKWAYLDKDVPVPYINTDSNLDYDDLSGLLTSLNVTYDRVKVHILSGYRLDDLQGLILQLYVKEAQTSKVSVFCNNVFLNRDDRDILNPKPVLLGEKLYDRYFEVLVPSLKEANEDYYANPTNPLSIGYQYTTDNNGFLYESAIYAKVYEIGRTETKNGHLFLFTSREYEVNINQQDVYSLLTANIQEASDGDYFLYYPSYDGNFVEDFISDLNASGGNYIVINDIDVYEQVGLDHILTFSFSQVQQGGFDEPLTYRPILKYADSAVSFSIDYTVRIFNRDNGYQIIRKSSSTSFNPRKYGKQLEKINLSQVTSPFKVYNKVYSGAQISYTKSDYTPAFTTVYVPVFYETRNISAQVKTVLSSGVNPLSPDFYDSVIFGQGDARIYLSEFDTYFKFVFMQQDSNGAFKRLDLSASEISLSFKDSTGKMISFAAENSTADSLKSNGEVTFKVSGVSRQKILFDDNVHSFYIVSTSSGFETLLYSGSVDKVENVGKEIERVKSIVTSSTSISSSTSASTEVKVPTEVINSTTSASVDTSSAEKTQPVSIPGYSNDSQATSIKSGLKPVSQNNSVNSKLTQVPGNDITK